MKHGVARHQRIGLPVYQGNRDHTVGTVSVKAIYANLAAGVGVKLKDLMVAPLIVPESQTVLQLVETFKQTGKHIALATDEFGSIVGLVTLNDVMEAVVGEFPSQGERAKPEAKKREDGSWLIDAMIDLEAVERALPGFKFGGTAYNEYQTLAGYVVKTLGHVPKEAYVGEQRADALRVYTPQEQEHLGEESIGFISFLESAGVLPPPMREMVIDRASAISGSPLDLEDLKIIVLMVFWSLGEEPDALILDELFVDPEDRLIH